MGMMDYDSEEKRDINWLSILMIVLGVVCAIIVIFKFVLPLFHEDEVNNNDEVIEAKLKLINAYSKSSWAKYREMVIIDTDKEEGKVLGDISSKVTSEWQCLGSVINSDDKSLNKGKSLFEILELDKSDFRSLGNVYEDEVEDAGYCSAIRKEEDDIVILLVASKGSSYELDDKIVTYAFSNKENGEYK